MIYRVSLAVLPLSLIAAEPSHTGRFLPSRQTGGEVTLTTGSQLARGSGPPTRPSAGAFIAGQHLGDGQPAGRVRAPFRADDVTEFPGRLEVLFHARTRPVHIRVHVRTHGKSVPERWKEHVGRLFSAFDRDGDGWLNRYEVEHVFPTSGLQTIFQGEQYYRSGEAGPFVADLDRDGDSRVSPAELASYYSEVVSDLIRSRPTPFVGGTDTATPALFARLDGNSDGKLARSELQDAERVLLALDSDGDECVTAQEVLAGTRPAPAGDGVTFPEVKTTLVEVDSMPRLAPQEMEIFHTEIPTDATKSILNRYDTDKDSKLSRQEVAFSSTVWKRLDQDGDDRLTETELDRWRTSSPDATISLQLGDSPETCRASASPPVGTSWPAEIAIRQVVPDRLVLRIGSQTVEFSATAQPPGMQRRVMQDGSSSAFPSGKSSVTETDLVGPQYQFLRVVFFDADLDGNGTLTRDEFNRYFKLQQDTMEIALALSHAVRTPNLFQMLDDNLDEKLSVRELRTAWDRMIVLEPSGTGAVTRAILQPSGAVRLTTASYAFSQPTLESRTTQSNPSSANVPIWFRKMDRNADGDVSRHEFLGGADDFERLDSDRDGLIALAEALKYEQQVRPKKESQKKK